MIYDERALAKALTLVEQGKGETILQEARSSGKKACVVGITGAPGSGKSTLVDCLILQSRQRGEKVAVLAVDPSSPFSGGAILGDRIRMGRHYQDKGVFIRSMASRGRLGGLARATAQATVLLEAVGFDRIFIETVGVGQSEVDIASVADHTVLVLTPVAGDAVQTVKAGVMEIADIFAINKADLGADQLERELRAALELGHGPDPSWQPLIKRVIATKNEGVAELLAAIDQHRQHLGQIGLDQRRAKRARFEIESIIADELQKILQKTDQQVFAEVAAGLKTPESIANSLVEKLKNQNK